MDCVKLGDRVIVKDEKNTMLHNLQAGKLEVRYYKSRLDLTNAIGNPYWSWYTLEPRGKNKYSVVLCENKPEIRVDRAESGTDNRNIQDDPTSQLLSKEELNKMKEDGMSTNNIIQNLVDNSKSFASKTQYSQEKYLSKKSKKHSNVVQILKPTIPLLADIFLKGPLYLGLRWDTLSQITTSLDMRANKVYIVYENHCQGVVSATLLNLLGEDGKIINIVTPINAKDKRHALHAMQFENEKLKRYVSVKFEEIAKLNLSSNESETTLPSNGSDFGHLDEATESKRQRGKNLKTENDVEKSTSNEKNEPEDVEILINLVSSTHELDNNATKNVVNERNTEIDASNNEMQRENSATEPFDVTAQLQNNATLNSNGAVPCENNAIVTSEDVTHGKYNALATSDDNNATETSDENNATGTSYENNATGTSDENNAMGTSDENNATEMSDENYAMGTSDENNATGTSDENNATGMSDENYATGTSDENNAMEMLDENSITDALYNVANNGKNSTEASEVITDMESNATRKRKLDKSVENKCAQSRNHDEILSLRNRKADGLVIVCKENPKVILRSLLKLVLPSRNFVVYSQYREQLVELYQELRLSPSVIRLRLFDNFMRKYQVLPERTHPLNSMDGTGGYLLAGTVVEE